jgi:hypothetical protein
VPPVVHACIIPHPQQKSSPKAGFSGGNVLGVCKESKMVEALGIEPRSRNATMLLSEAVSWSGLAPWRTCRIHSPPLLHSSLCQSIIHPKLPEQPRLSASTLQPPMGSLPLGQCITMLIQLPTTKATFFILDTPKCSVISCPQS